MDDGTPPDNWLGVAHVPDVTSTGSSPPYTPPGEPTGGGSIHTVPCCSLPGGHGSPTSPIGAASRTSSSAACADATTVMAATAASRYLNIVVLHVLGCSSVQVAQRCSLPSLCRPSRGSPVDTRHGSPLLRRFAPRAGFAARRQTFVRRGQKRQHSGFGPSQPSPATRCRGAQGSPPGGRDRSNFAAGE